MNGYTSKTTGGLVLLVGIVGILAPVTLLLFFVGLFQNIPSISFMGKPNDTVNSLTGILYPIWCLWLGRWILSKQIDRAAAAQGQGLQ